jgi:hypothetical protein
MKTTFVDFIKFLKFTKPNPDLFKVSLDDMNIKFESKEVDKDKKESGNNPS